MLHPLAQDGLFRITAHFDRQTLLDFFVAFHDRIQELDDLAARERRRPCAQDDIDRLDAPLVVGNVAFRRPSAAAMDWLRTCAALWWGESTRAYTFALAFACAHRGEAAYVPLRSRPRASWACWRYCLGIRASEETIRRAALALLPPPDDSLRWFGSADGAPGRAPDLLDIALRLVKVYGQTPAYWLYDVADADFWGAACNVADQADDDLNLKAAEAGQSPGEHTWWRLHRRALARCETALEADALAWAGKRKPKEPARE